MYTQTLGASLLDFIIVRMSSGVRRAAVQMEACSNGVGSTRSDCRGPSCDVEGSAGIFRCPQVTQTQRSHHPLRTTTPAHIVPACGAYLVRACARGIRHHLRIPQSMRQAFSRPRGLSRLPPPLRARLLSVYRMGTRAPVESCLTPTNARRSMDSETSCARPFHRTRPSYALQSPPDQRKPLGRQRDETTVKSTMKMRALPLPTGLVGSGIRCHARHRAQLQEPRAHGRPCVISWRERFESYRTHMDLGGCTSPRCMTSARVFVLVAVARAKPCLPRCRPIVPRPRLPDIGSSHQRADPPGGDM
ncbi:hypothetical protein B0H13DRAFT_106228 [Mycena leptocephala]|nr:hypothetical protein B0H13DRAFT_106228 [Mycena leptocephala]